MLYVGCSYCRSVVPLWCAGQFLPHVPLPAAASPQGVYCNLCGPLFPVFTCTFCWARQMLFLPGVTSVPSSLCPGPTANIAPVIQAPPGASPSVLSDLFKQAASGFLSQLGKEAATALFQTGGEQSW